MKRKDWPEIFPYEPRPNQKVIMKHIDDALDRKGHLIVESGTGSGKTICSMAPAMEYSLKHKKKVLYLTRTNSQQKQVIIELRKIQTKKKIFGIGMQGRKNMCPLLEDRPDLKKGSAEELSKICGDLKKASNDGGKGCKYYSNLLYYQEIHFPILQYYFFHTNYQQKHYYLLLYLKNLLLLQ